MKSSPVFFKSSENSNYLLEQFLEYVVNGNHDMPVDLAKKHPSLILEKGSVKEKCGRVWKSVSVLEYAAWAGDKFLVNMLLQNLAAEDKSRALQQLKEVRQEGTENGKYLSPVVQLIQAYDEHRKFTSFNNTLIEFIAGQKNNNWCYINEKVKSNWENTVIKAQLNLPINLLQYLNSYKIHQQYEKVDPMPDFQLPAQRISVNAAILPWERWDSQVSDPISPWVLWLLSLPLKPLEYIVGVIVNEDDCESASDNRTYSKWPIPDIIQQFCKMRSNDLDMQISELESSLNKNANCVF